TISSSLSAAGCSSPSPSANALADLFREDLLERRPLGKALELPFGRVLCRDREIACGTELLRDRQHPLDQLLDPRAGRTRPAALEIEELTREAVPDGAPYVLLEQPVRMVGERLSLVERSSAANGERVRERHDRASLVQVRLAVHDPHLDGREREVRP